MQYWHFLVLLLMVFATAISLVMSRLKKKKAFTFGAFCISLFGIWLVWEILPLVVFPLKPVKNLWFTDNPSGVIRGFHLPFERPAHMEWEGLSTGDIAEYGKAQDPYAKKVRFETDHQGFRNSQDTAQAEIVFLGDSYTEAGNVNEDKTFVHLTGKKTNQTVRNLGRAGYGPLSELTVLKQYALDTNPKFVIWQIAERNDLKDAAAEDNWQKIGRPPYLEFETDKIGMRSAMWKRLSPSYHLWLFLKQRFDQEPVMPLYGEFLDVNKKRHTVYFAALPSALHQTENHAGWPLLKDALIEGKALLSEKGISLAVLFIPMKMRVFETALENPSEEIRRWLANPSSKRESEFGKALQVFCKTSEIAFLDPTEPLREKTKQGVLVFPPLDTHLSEAGHEAVEKIVVHWLTQKGQLNPDESLQV